MVSRMFIRSKKTIEELKALAPKKDYLTSERMGELFLKIVENRNMPPDSKGYKRREEEIYKLFKELSKKVGPEKLKNMVGEERYNNYFARAFTDDCNK